MMDTVSAPDAFAPFITALAKAHKLHHPAVEPGGALPATIAEAMAVQAAVASETGATVAGWKVGYAPDNTPFAAPLYAHLTQKSGARIPMRQSGVWGLEPEIAVRLGGDLPPRPGRAYSRDEIMDAIDTVLAGIEIVGSRIVGYEATPFPVRLADNFLNAGYIAGAELADWRHLDLTALLAAFTFDGAEMHAAAGGHPNGDPLKPLHDYANAQCDRLGGLKAGQIVTTGSLCGLVVVPRPVEAVMTLQEVGEVRLQLEPAAS